MNRLHQLGKRSTNQNKSRPITVKIVKHNIQRKIFYSKKKLNSKKNSTTESLAKIRMENLKKSRATIWVSRCLVVRRMYVQIWK